MIYTHIFLGLAKRLFLSSPVTDTAFFIAVHLSLSSESLTSFTRSPLLLPACVVRISMLCCCIEIPSKSIEIPSKFHQNPGNSLPFDNI